MRLMPTSMTTAPGLTASAPSRPRNADRGDQDVGAGAGRRQVPGPRVADRDGRVGGQQQPGDRHPDQLRAADDDRLRPLQLDPLVAQQLHHPGRRAGHQPRRAVREQAGVERRQPVDVLGRVDRADDRVGVDLVGDRQLDEDPVDLVVGAQPRDQLQQLGLAGRSRRGRGGPIASLPPRRRGACCGCRSPRPDRRRRSPSPGSAPGPPRRHELGDFAAHPLPHRRRHRLAVDHPRRHRRYRLRIGA